MAKIIVKESDITVFSMNSVLIEEGLPQSDRLVRLNEMAIRQMEILSGSGSRDLLK